MRLLSYVLNGTLRHGAIDPQDLSGECVRDLGAGDLLALFERGGLNDLPRHTRSAPRIDLSTVTVRAPLRRPPKLLAVAANYAAHVTNSGGLPADPTQSIPRLFLKPSTSITGYDSDIQLPKVAAATDWEAELGVVIGRAGKDIPEHEALRLVGGYVSANDVSARKLDFGFTRKESDVHPFFDWLAGKWFDGFAPLGPWIVTADEVDDPQDLDLHLDVNGQIHQQGSTADMLFGVAELVSFASRLFRLEPGDVILTGTPAGAGVETGRVFLEPGDIMTTRVGNLGTLRNRIVGS